MAAQQRNVDDRISKQLKEEKTEREIVAAQIATLKFKLTKHDTRIELLEEMQQSVHTTAEAMPMEQERMLIDLTDPDTALRALHGVANTAKLGQSHHPEDTQSDTEPESDNESSTSGLASVASTRIVREVIERRPSRLITGPISSQQSLGYKSLSANYPTIVATCSAPRRWVELRCNVCHSNMRGNKLLSTRGTKLLTSRSNKLLFSGVLGLFKYYTHHHRKRGVTHKWIVEHCGVKIFSEEEVQAMLDGRPEAYLVEKSMVPAEYWGKSAPAVARRQR